MNLFSLYAKIGLDTSEYDKGVKQSKTYSQSLEKELQKVSSEVKGLESKYKDSVSATGRYSEETIELADKLEEAKKKQKDLAEELESSNSALDKSSELAKKYAFNLSDIGSKISTVLVTGLKAAATAVGAAASGIGALSVAAINSYAEYEQLVGGVETLFKDSAAQVKAYADAAYQTAGMSANEYMDTVTSFSATLLQGLGNDTAKAAEYGNKAVVQMSDNANKMGTSMSAIQYAYQGFAKQNYTMLDNLKLGYGGTQAEMARLINDSGVLGDTMEVTADTVNQVSFATIIDAIGVVQDRLGITGTTAKEAASTIQGSISTMKSAWSNLLTALTSSDMDVGEYTSRFAESVKTVIANVAPRITEALPNITAAIGEIFTQLAPYLSETVQTLLPVLVQGAITLVTSLAAQLPEILSVLTDTIKNTFTNVFNALAPEVQTNLLTIFNAFQTLIPAITGITAAVVAFRTAMTISAIIQGVSQAITAFKAANDAATISQAALNAVMNLNPFVLIATLIAGVVVALITLWNTNEDFRNAVIKIWNAIQEKFKEAWEAIKDIWDNVEPYFVSLWNSIKATFSVVSAVLGQYFSNAWNAVSAVWGLAGGYFQNIFNTIKGIFSAVTAVFRGDFEGAWNAVKNVFSGWYSYFQGLFEQIKSIFSGVRDVFLKIGESTIEALKQGISNAWNGLVNWFNNLWNGLFSNRTASVTVNTTENRTVKDVDGSHASGLTYVPFDGYIAELHKGEQVLTAKEANDYRSGRSGGGITVVQNIYSQAKTAADLMLEARHQQERAVLLGV